MSTFYDRQGRPMDLAAWAGKVEDRDYATVAQHWVRGWMVSTVWLGIDHGFGMTRAPLIFETMIFPPGEGPAGGGSGWADEYSDRYATEGAARAGHNQALSWLREKRLVPGSSDSEWDGSLPEA